MKRWRARGWEAATRRPHPWGAALAAAGLAGAALLLAFVFHLGVTAVAAAILATMPALYLAWKVVPAKKLTRDRLAWEWDPEKLGVHRVVGGGPMPPYIYRPHDDLLAAVLDPAVQASRLVVLRGESSTGKSRAAYEAITGEAARRTGLANWRLDYPQGPSSLTARLKDGIPARTILWLGELRQYADADGGAEALDHLSSLLDGEGQIIITTVWPDDWEKYTAAAQGRPTADSAGAAGRLLRPLPDLTAASPAAIDASRGGVIGIPPQFAGQAFDTVGRSDDPVLMEAVAAAAAAGHPGQVTQYLAGVPALLRRYAGDGGDPYGQAVITAAMDATRLGHASLIPATLLHKAAVGYLADEQRIQDLTTWAQTALAWAAAKLDGAVRALEPIPPPAGTGVVGYRVADYLDQHGRRTREDQPVPASLWDALMSQTTSSADLNRLGEAAQKRGLYRQAAALWTVGVTVGSADAAQQLFGLLRQVSSEDFANAAYWTTVHVNPANTFAVGRLIEALHQAGAEDAARALAERAAAQDTPHDPRKVTALLSNVHKAGASDAARTLAERAATHVSVDDPGGVATLLEELRAAGAADAARTLADRAAVHVSLDYPRRRRRPAEGDTRSGVRGRRPGSAGSRPRRLRHPRSRVWRCC